MYLQVLLNLAAIYREVSPDQRFHELKFIGKKENIRDQWNTISARRDANCSLVDSWSYLDVYVIYQEIEHLN